MKMQFGDVTQPADAQAKFSRVSAMLLLAWQPRPKVPWAGRSWGDGCRWLLGGREEGEGGGGFPGPLALMCIWRLLCAYWALYQNHHIESPLPLSETSGIPAPILQMGDKAQRSLAPCPRSQSQEGQGLSWSHPGGSGWQDLPSSLLTSHHLATIWDGS